MTASVKFRLALFSGAIVAVGAMIGIAAHMTAREVHLLGQQWSSEAIESFRTADQFRADLIELDYRLLIVLSRNDVAEFDRFKLASKKLDAWIDTQRPLLTSEPERQIL